MYLINHEGENLDPMDHDAVESMIEAGTLQRDDWVWDDNTEAWAPLSEIFPEHFPSFGQPIPENVDEGELPTTIIPPADPLSVERFIGDGQRKKLVVSVIEVMKTVLEPNECLLYVVTQRKPMPDFSPEAFALTTDRLFIVEKGHFRTTYEELPLVNILNPQLSSGLFFSSISMSAGAGIPYGIKFIPKKQAAAFYTRFKEMLQSSREANRLSLGANTKKSEGVQITPLKPSQDNAAEAPTESIPADSKPEKDEHLALHHMEDLKEMLDKGLITEEDYEAKKQSILDKEL